MTVPADAKQKTLTDLRRRMAAIPARGVEPSREPVADSVRADRLPVPAVLEELLPDGRATKGTVITYTGAQSLLSGMLASVTAAGGYAAAVGLPRLGLLAAVEMGARLDRLAVVADPGSDPLEVVSVLLDGLDLVVLGLNGRSVPAARARVLAGRARNLNSSLLVTGGDWPGPAVSIETRVAGYDGLGRGSGRLRVVHLDVRVRSRSAPPRLGHLTLTPRDGQIDWVRTSPNASAPTGPEQIGRHVAS